MNLQRPLLVLMAHPDDEFAITPWLETARREGREATCVWLTDGGWGGQCVATRKRESERALAALGVPADRLHFAGELLSIPDGALHERLDDAVGWLQRHFATTVASMEVWVPAWEGGHPDHDATHLAGLFAARAASAPVRQFPLYHGKGLSGPWFRVLDAIAENGRSVALPAGPLVRLRSLTRCLGYRSQWKSFLGLLPFMALRMLSRHPFVMQDARWERTAERPHGGALLYERRNGISWEQFGAATTRYRAAG